MPAYEPDKWNNSPIQDGTNCYDYAADNRGDLKRYGSQPGRAHGHKLTIPVSCREVDAGAVADGFKKSDKNALCDFNCWKVALVVDRRGKDYHWYRQDPSGNWSHKRGAGPVHAHDAVGHAITDPERAARNYGTYNYSIFCGYYCVCPGAFVIASVQPDSGVLGEGEQQAFASSRGAQDIVVRLKEDAILANSGMEVHLPAGLIRISREPEATDTEGVSPVAVTQSEPTLSGVVVQAMIRSGMPDPTWALDEERKAALSSFVMRALDANAQDPFAADLPGFLVRNLSETYPLLYVGYDGVIVTLKDGISQYREAMPELLDLLLTDARGHAEVDDILGSFEL